MLGVVSASVKPGIRVLNQNRITRIVDGILTILTLMSRVDAGKGAAMF
jgi:hypothetical protein